MIASINPANGETLRVFQPLTDQQVEDKLARSQEAYLRYRKTSFLDRARWLTRAADILENERDRLGHIMTLEMGKPIGSARSEANKCALACRYYAENGERLLADERIDGFPGRTFLRYQPIGALLAVMPWNFPFWQVFRFAAPALMAGNVGLLKHASNVPQCALAIEDIVRRAGFPEDVFQTLLISSDQVAALIDDPRVQAVSLTGSEPAGAEVAGQRRAADQEDRPRTGRQRSLHRHAQRRSGPRGQSRGGSAHAQQRPVLHRRQAVHRGRGGLR